MIRRVVVRRGMIHGRFQPFHNGHLEYLREAADRSDDLFVGITNPDPDRIRLEPSDPERHLPGANPFTFIERLLMVKAAAQEIGLGLEQLHIVPFPISEPELWSAYVPRGATHFLRVHSPWGQAKLERLRAVGYEVVVLESIAAKEVSGRDVRAALADREDWRRLVPAGVARILDEIRPLAR